MAIISHSSNPLVNQHGYLSLLFLNLAGINFCHPIMPLSETMLFQSLERLNSPTECKRSLSMSLQLRKFHLLFYPAHQKRYQKNQKCTNTFLHLRVKTHLPLHYLMPRPPTKLLTSSKLRKPFLPYQIRKSQKFIIQPFSNQLTRERKSNQLQKALPGNRLLYLCPPNSLKSSQVKLTLISSRLTLS